MNDKHLCDTCMSNRFLIDFPNLPGSRDEASDVCIFCISAKPDLYPGGLTTALCNMTGFSPKAKELAAKHAEAIDMEADTSRARPTDSLPTTGDIVDDLNDYIIGQDRAKRVLAIALRNHLLRQQLGDGVVELKKSNVLLVGPTGSGKTAIVNRLAKIAGVDVLRLNAADFTEAGYVGKDVADIPEMLFEHCEGNINRVERAIVYVDEIDKKRSGGMITRDVSGVGVQQAFLKLIEGGMDDAVEVGPQKRQVKIDMTKVLFIFSGAFAGIEEVIRQRLTKEGKLRDRSIGFTGADEVTATADQLLASLTNADLVAYGMVPEFSGRVPAKATLFTLTEDQLVAVLRDTANSPITQLEVVAEAEGADLLVTDDALRWVARTAIARGTGARGLEEVLEEALEDYKFNLGNGDYNGKAVVVDEVDGNLTIVVDDK